MTIYGTDFQLGATVRLNLSGPARDEIPPSSVLFVDEAQIRATFILPDYVADNPWTVVVINPDGQYDTLKRAITIYPAPVEPAPDGHILGFSPPRLISAPDQKLTVRGENLDLANTTVILAGGAPQALFIPSTVVQLSAPNTVIATFDLSNIPPTTEVMVLVEDPGNYTLVTPGKLTIAGTKAVAAKGRNKK